MVKVHATFAVRLGADLCSTVHFGKYFRVAKLYLLKVFGAKIFQKCKVFFKATIGLWSNCQLSHFPCHMSTLCLPSCISALFDILFKSNLVESSCTCMKLK